MGKVEIDLGSSPDMVKFSEAIEVPETATGEAFANAQDLSRAEKYHRVFQMMLFLWSKVSAKRNFNATWKEKWELFWKTPGLLSDKVVDPEEFAPIWMRASAK